MADAADLAGDLIDESTQRALDNRKAIRVQVTEDCADCGLQISSARQIATGGTDTCIACAEYLEEKRKVNRQ